MRAYLAILVVVVAAMTMAVSCGKTKDSKPNADDPKTAADYMRRAKANFLSKNSAIKDCDKAIELDPTLVEAYEFRAECYTALHAKTDNEKHARQAMADYDRLLELEPANAQAADYHRKRGLLKLKINDTDGAIADLRASGKADRNQPRTYEYLAQAFLAKDDTENAIKAYGIAIGFDSRNTALYKARAAIYKDMKDYDSAIADLMRVVDIEPDNSTYIALGELCEANGDKLAAIDWYNKVKEEDKPGPN